MDMHITRYETIPRGQSQVSMILNPYVYKIKTYKERRGSRIKSAKTFNPFG
jgi:hypothetical protein